MISRGPARQLLGLLLLLALAVILRLIWRPSSLRPGQSDRQMTDIARKVSEIETREHQIAETTWAKELLAERCARCIEDLWDSINAATNKLAVLSSLDAREIIPPAFSAPLTRGPGIQVLAPDGTRAPWNAPEWSRFLAGTERAGWELVRTEFRHIQFDTDEAGRPRQSRFYCAAHLTRTNDMDRAILEGNLAVDWQPGPNPAALPSIARIDASALELRSRHGPPGFREIWVGKITPPEGSFFIDPLILHDLDGDGLSEIILAAKNLVLHRTANGEFEPRPLCRFPPGLIMSGIVGDFDGDGLPDFLCAKFDGLYLFKGSATGTFDEPGQQVWAARPHLKYAQTLTCGDVDGDGDLDLFLGQYKLPYVRGQMPTPYFDANDGYPSYLLLNDGHGHFTDATASAGLSPKRWRRTYSASFVDFNQDGHLDLVVASDFAGLDLYTNDGHGHFTDVTHDALPEAHGFGMSQICADFDGDGRPDLLMIGMNVPTMDRLLHFGCSRPGRPQELAFGRAMTYGNRLFLRQAAGGFRQTALNEPIARTGWSWGCNAFDLDNDGYPDLYIANGHESKQTVRDYEPEFYLHDIYAGTSRDDAAAFVYFRTKQTQTRGRGMSYGGYERNRLFWNDHGRTFLEVAHLMGVSLGEDCRNVVADDLDGDGRMDLLVTTFEAWPEVQQTLHIFRNELDTRENWIGFRFKETAGQPSPIGVRVSLHLAGRTAVQTIVAGDAYRSQRASTLHFGLGAAERVEEVEIRWPSGKTVRIKEPPINQYHTVSGLSAK
jgi:hypothetical protein